MFCSKCGAEIQDGHKFCMSCGAPVVAPKVMPTANPMPNVTPQPEVAQKVEPKVKKPKTPKEPKASKVEAPMPDSGIPKKKKSKVTTVVLIIVAALIVAAIVLIALKLLWNNKPTEIKQEDDNWASVSEGTQAPDDVSAEDVDTVLNEQLKSIVSEKGDIRGKSLDMCKGKNITGWNGVMGSAILDVSGDGVDDLIVVYAENNAIYADAYTVEGDSAISKGKRIARLNAFDYVDGCELLGGVYLKQTSDGWNLITDAYSLAWMFSDGVLREVHGVSCKDHAYESVDDYEYSGSDMEQEDYDAGNDAAAKMGMSGVKNSLNSPYFEEDPNVTLIAAYHSELLPLTIAENTSVKSGEKYGEFYIDNVDSTDSSAAANLVKIYNKARDEAEKERETAEQENSDYILPMSSEREITEEDLADIKDDAWMLKLARNEIYARHGRMFKDESIQEYFDSKDWYEPKYTAEEFESEHKDLISKLETKNATFIQKYEDKLNN